MREFDKIAADRRHLIAKQIRCSTGFTERATAPGRMALRLLSSARGWNAAMSVAGKPTPDQRGARSLKAPALLAVMVLGISAAVAAPPAPDSEDARLLGPHRTWLHGLMTPQGNSCCDESDCRPVEARATAAGWQVRWRAGQLPGAPTEWTDVPEKAVLRRENPVGVPVACWFAGRVQCFVPAGLF
jgi:hypothetical protein